MPSERANDLSLRELLGCIVLLPAALAPNVRTAVVLLLFACAAIGLFSSNCWALTQTLAGPEASGRWTGIQNAVGNLGGVLSPFVTGYLVNRNGSFLLPFAIASLMLLLGAAGYFFLVREEPHRRVEHSNPWNLLTDVVLYGKNIRIVYGVCPN